MTSDQQPCDSSRETHKAILASSIVARPKISNEARLTKSAGIPADSYCCAQCPSFAVTGKAIRHVLKVPHISIEHSTDLPRIMPQLKSSMRGLCMICFLW